MSQTNYGADFALDAATDDGPSRQVVPIYPMTDGLNPENLRDFMRQALAAGGKHQQSFGFQVHGFGQQQRTQTLAQRGTAGFPRHHYLKAACAQPAADGTGRRRRHRRRRA